MKHRLNPISHVKTRLHDFFFKCRKSQTCELFVADSWFCTEDGGDHCGKARSTSVWDLIGNRPGTPLSLRVAADEPREVVSPRMSWKRRSKT